MTIRASATAEEDDAYPAFSSYGQLQDIQEKLERFIDRAKYHGEHSGSLAVFEEILTEVKIVIDHEERFF